MLLSVAALPSALYCLVIRMKRQYRLELLANLNSVLWFDCRPSCSVSSRTLHSFRSAKFRNVSRSQAHKAPSLLLQFFSSSFHGEHWAVLGLVVWFITENAVCTLFRAGGVQCCCWCCDGSLCSLLIVLLNRFAAHLCFFRRVFSFCQVYSSLCSLPPSEISSDLLHSTHHLCLADD